MSHKPLSLDAVQALSEVWEGFMLMDRYGVSKEHCVCLQDIKDRLTLHHYKMMGQARSTEAVSTQNFPTYTGGILGLRPANERRRYIVTRLWLAARIHKMITKYNAVPLEQG